MSQLFSFFPYIRNFYKKGSIIILLSIMISVIQALLLIPIAYFIKETFDNAIPNQNTKQIVWYGLSIISLFVVSSSIAIYIRWKVLELVKKHIKKLRIQLIDTYLSLPRKLYTQLSPEKLHVLLGIETERQDRMLNALFGTLIPSTIVSLILIASLLYISPTLFVYAFSGLVLIFLMHKVLANKSKLISNVFHKTFDEFYRGIMFISHKTDLIHNQATESYESTKQKRKIENVFISSVNMVKTNTLFRFAQENVMIILGVFLIFIGANMVTSNVLSVGELLSFYLVIGLLRSHMGVFSSSLPDIVEGKESLKTLHEFLSSPKAIYTGKQKVEIKGNIHMSNIYFSYDNKQVLQGVQLQLVAGKCIALYGKNGSGKSTIISLLQGYYRPDQGTIIVDGVSYDNMDIQYFRKQIGVVQQQPILFSGSIYENIIYGHANTDLQKVKEVAKYAGISSFIESLPNAYETQIGDNGILLSGGQQQRIVLARAIINEPAVLILDEPTNHLDDTSISLLLEQLKNLSFAPAILLISHHKLIHNIADEVYQLESGKTDRIK
ncbi:ABC transporter ATP-binding protein [Aquimarina sp. 2201CG14-23]|uniref:ABC transporter ATP-binding protein n=1 Tax=Aquimarina mycalae TaxID=3040073 RepID=UPI0024782648|nr:ABC transporter ATP-binding protein [Aquimarina sp. 2201CG14-23]MDH7445526.1 ABC transporter ATP-binding protein [Aquimarina sp. 2201CG14-23]